MYFSGEKSKNITFHDPDRECIRIKPEVYARAQLNNEQNARFFLDTHLLRVHSLPGYALEDDL